MDSAANFNRRDSLQSNFVSQTDQAIDLVHGIDVPAITD
ncbi:hypothetical protein X750_27205 [Mesorhizobium sp. LNJC394B00]|nr:hypothetical protein X750_27205 [Mesorhizobium sp. LNJC394B00]ESZ75071.1 hypothetical protein X726_18895 [Mesorhizobium sp. L103C105A0]